MIKRQYKMKRSTTYFQFVLIVFLFISGTAAANNIVLNAGFEASPNLPTNWMINGPVAAMQPVTSIDNHNKYLGSFALKMESTNPNAHGRAVQTVHISGGLTYLVTARFLTKNVNSIDK